MRVVWSSHTQTYTQGPIFKNTFIKRFIFTGPLPPNDHNGQSWAGPKLGERSSNPGLLGGGDGMARSWASLLFSQAMNSLTGATVCRPSLRSHSTHSTSDSLCGFSIPPRPSSPMRLKAFFILWLFFVSGTQYYLDSDKLPHLFTHCPFFSVFTRSSFYYTPPQDSTFWGPVLCTAFSLENLLGFFSSLGSQMDPLYRRAERHINRAPRFSRGVPHAHLTGFLYTWYRTMADSSSPPHTCFPSINKLQLVVPGHLAV